MKPSSQRLLQLLRGQPADRPPYWEPWFAMRDLLQARWNGDYLTMACDLDMAAVPIGSVSVGFTFAKAVERDPGTGVWYGGGQLRSREQLRQCPRPAYDAILKHAAALRQRCTDAGVACWMVLPWCFHVVATQMGLEHFALTCYDDPAFIAECMAEVEARNRAAIEQVIAKVRPDFVLYDGDCAYRTGTMIDPRLMRQLTFDLTLPNMHAIRQMDIPVAFHSDGKLDDVIPLLLDLGVAAVHGCEKQANELDHLVNAFGERLVLCGNMDVVFLHEASPAEVREQTLRMLETGWRRHRYIAGCNTSPQDYIPEANYRMLIQTVNDWRP